MVQSLELRKRDEGVAKENTQAFESVGLRKDDGTL